MDEPSAETRPATAELLTRYVSGEAAAFGALTERYYPLVLAAALRRCEGRQSLAEDAAQQVFIDLARRAAGLRPDERLGGWLHQRAVRAAGDLMKSETRRRRRETEAAARMHPDTSEPRWADAAPFMDAALQRLSARDRDAVLLRCVEGRDLREVGSALGLSADAAQKCVSRALEKLRALLRRRGVVPTITVLTAGLAADQARAAGFSGAAAQALQSAGGALAATVPWLLHGKAVAAGAAMACAAWAWPMAAAVRRNAAAAAAAPVTNSQDANGGTPGGLRFPALPRTAKGQSVDEIVAGIAALAPLPHTESTKERFYHLSSQLGSRYGQALEKMRTTFSPSLMADVDRHHWRPLMIQNWALYQRRAALDYAWEQTPEYSSPDPVADGFMDAIREIAWDEQKKATMDDTVRWLAAGEMDEAAGQRRGQKFKALLGNCRTYLVSRAVEKKSREMLELAVTLVNKHRLPLLDNAGYQATDAESLEMLAAIVPQLEAPARRAALMGNVLDQLANLDFPAARRLIEATEPPAQRLIYARRVALTNRVSVGTGPGPKPQDKHKEHADWLLGLTPAEERETVMEEISEHWMFLEPPWAVQWLSTRMSRTEFLTWLKRQIKSQAQSFASQGHQSSSQHMPLFLEHLRRADPEGAAGFLEEVGAQNGFQKHAEELKALLAP